MSDFLHNFFRDPMTWLGLAVGFAVSVWQHLNDISKTLHRIEGLLKSRSGAGG